MIGDVHNTRYATTFKVFLSLDETLRQEQISSVATAKNKSEVFWSSTMLWAISQALPKILALMATLSSRQNFMESWHFWAVPVDEWWINSPPEDIKAWRFGSGQLESRFQHPGSSKLGGFTSSLVVAVTTERGSAIGQNSGVMSRFEMRHRGWMTDRHSTYSSGLA